MRKGIGKKWDFPVMHEFFHHMSVVNLSFCVHSLVNLENRKRAKQQSIIKNKLFIISFSHNLIIIMSTVIITVDCDHVCALPFYRYNRSTGFSN